MVCCYFAVINLLLYWLGCPLTGLAQLPFICSHGLNDTDLWVGTSAELNMPLSPHLYKKEKALHKETKCDLEKERERGTIFQGQIIDPTELKAAIRQKRQERAGKKGKYLSNYQLWSMFLRVSWKDRLLSFNASQHRNHSRPSLSLYLQPASPCARAYTDVRSCVRVRIHS